MSKISGSLSICIFFLANLWLPLFMNSYPANAADGIPAAYTGVYQTLERVLDAELAALNKSDKPLPMRFMEFDDVRKIAG
jgi:hypothetical protein